MTPEVKAKWVAALRSGQYKQAKGVLNEVGVGHCCLGVLADVILPDRWGPRVFFEDRVVVTLESGGDSSCTSIPFNLQKELGIPTGECTKLSGMNDGRGGAVPQSFAQIADWIEANL